MNGEKVEESAELGLGDPPGVALALHRGEGGEGEEGRGRGRGGNMVTVTLRVTDYTIGHTKWQEHLLCTLGDTEPIINMHLVYVHITVTNMHLVCLIS